jgi:hypothetical protein
MMGGFVYSMNVSLDLRIEQVPEDNGAGEWLRISEELHREFNAHAGGRGDGPGPGLLRDDGGVLAAGAWGRVAAGRPA